MKKILFVIASQGFQDLELKIPKEILEKNNISTFICSDKKGYCKGALGGIINSEFIFGDIDPLKFDGIIFIGGIGCINIRKNHESNKLCKDFYKLNKIIGAICLAPTILAINGILKNKKATVYVGIDPDLNLDTRDILKQNNCLYINKTVVVDGNIITANGPSSAKEFGEEFLKLINKND